MCIRDRDWVEQLLEQPQAPAASSPGSAELIAQLIAGSSAAKEAAAEPA